MSYPENWKTIRKAIIDHVCRICFEPSMDGGLHVHHMDYRKHNNKPSNLVSLCQKCHAAVHLDNYKPHDHIDWPPPWKITRPSQEEFLLMLASIKTIPAPRKPTKKKNYFKHPGYWPASKS